MVSILLLTQSRAGIVAAVLFVWSRSRWLRDGAALLRAVAVVAVGAGCSSSR